ncbi:MAG TPA: hypothetical protein VFW87_24160 [Pirellulales bacterium]|nr:hypothetical protein [Pirellulales bacterium]
MIPHDALRRSAGWVIGFGVLLIVLGTLAVLAPLLTTGWALTASGLAARRLLRPT